MILAASTSGRSWRCSTSPIAVQHEDLEGNITTTTPAGAPVVDDVALTQDRLPSLSGGLITPEDITALAAQNKSPAKAPAAAPAAQPQPQAGIVPASGQAPAGAGWLGTQPPPASVPAQPSRGALHKTGMGRTTPAAPPASAPARQAAPAAAPIPSEDAINLIMDRLKAHKAERVGAMRGGKGKVWQTKYDKLKRALELARQAGQ